MESGKLAVLEVNWEEQILKKELSRSVRPFLNGLEGELGVDFLEGEFNTRDDLVMGLREFKKSKAKLLYVGAHGVRKMLFDTSHGVNAATIIGACRNSKGKGYFFSACDFGNRNTAREFLSQTKADFVVGYSGPVPWLESSLVDLFFLSYFLQGRVKRRKGPKEGKVTLLETRYDFLAQGSRDPIKLAHWVYEDVPLALVLGFDVYILETGQGKKAKVVCASDTWKQ
jgi:hypothetical protein